MRFRDRADAGRRLATLLLPYRGGPGQVLGLAPGGLRVAFEVSRALGTPLDVWATEEDEPPVQALVGRLRGGRPRAELRGQTLLLVDEGVRGGERAREALRQLRALRPGRLVFATPVASARALELLRPEADALACLQVVPGLREVADWYEDFRPLPDFEVEQLLVRGRQPPSSRESLESTDSAGRWI